MFNQIFIPYLIQTNALTPEQARNAFEVQKTTKIRIGVLAVEENLMTEAQVDEVAKLQTSQNARFGDLAVQKGYLTKLQLESLLGKQQREHVALKQIVCDKNYMTSDGFDSALESFKVSVGVTGEDYLRLQHNDVNVYITRIACVDSKDHLMTAFCDLFVTVMLRLIDREVLVKKAYKTNRPPGRYLTTQKYKGGLSKEFVFSSATSDGFLKFAKLYSSVANNTALDEAQTSIKEFFNSIIRLLSSKLMSAGEQKQEFELPEFFNERNITAETTVFPFSLSIGDFYLYIV